MLAIPLSLTLDVYIYSIFPQFFFAFRYFRIQFHEHILINLTYDERKKNDNRVTEKKMHSIARTMCINAHCRQ